MGQVLTIMQHERKNLPEIDFLRNNSLSKVEEFYTTYKNTCDTFTAIDDVEF